MSYLNVDLQGLSGRPHPALMHTLNLQEIEKARAHLKFLTCDLGLRSYEGAEAISPCARNNILLLRNTCSLPVGKLLM